MAFPPTKEELPPEEPLGKPAELSEDATRSEGKPAQPDKIPAKSIKAKVGGSILLLAECFLPGLLLGIDDFCFWLIFGKNTL
jgi:hypothetical protein